MKIGSSHLKKFLVKKPSLRRSQKWTKNENVKHTFGTSSRSSQTQKQETKKKKLKRKEK
jgi:hypothetical protein